MLARGFAANRAEPDFLRVCLEWRGLDRWGSMAARLSIAAFELWAANGGFNGELPPHALAG